ncbi:hypothetical protein HC256_010215 [Beauveria bassiana]|nr:hypothetical protein HC256_010215 [Beauveria bassiana]
MELDYRRCRGHHCDAAGVAVAVLHQPRSPRRIPEIYPSPNASLVSIIGGWTLFKTSLGAIAQPRPFAKGQAGRSIGEVHESPKSWPAEGTIEMRGVAASHSLGIATRLKIGVCGRFRKAS